MEKIDQKIRTCYKTIGLLDKQTFPKVGQSGLVITEDEIRQRCVGEIPLVSIIMLVRNQTGMTRTALESLYACTTYPSYELIVIDNGSESDTRHMLQFFSEDNPHMLVVRNEQNASFSAANNQGAALASGTLVLFLNNDTECHDPVWLTHLVGELVTRGRCAAVGPRLLYPRSGRVQSAGVKMVVDSKTGSLRYAEEIRRPFPSRPVDGLTAACLLIRRDVFEKVGGFDEQFYYGQEDVDLCLTLRSKGYTLYHDADTSVVHHEHKTRRFDETTARNRLRIQRKWQGRLKDFTLVDP